jgi:hypothetical protein
VAVSELLPTSDGKTCRFSSSDEGVVSHGSREWDRDEAGVVSIGNAGAEVGMHETPGRRIQIRLVNKRVKGRRTKRTDLWSTAGSEICGNFP